MEALQVPRDSRSLRKGLKPRLKYEEALAIEEEQPNFTPFVVNAAWKAINSPLFVRLKDQLEEGNGTTAILAERQRDINVRLLAGQENVWGGFGMPGGVPVAGDWKGDGVTELGV